MNHLLSLIALTTFSGTVQSCWKSSGNVLPTTTPTSQLKETNVKDLTLREDFKDPYEGKNNLVLSLETFRAYWNISSTTKGLRLWCEYFKGNVTIEVEVGENYTGVVTVYEGCGRVTCDIFVKCWSCEYPDGMYCHTTYLRDPEETTENVSTISAVTISRKPVSLDVDVNTVCLVPRILTKDGHTGIGH